MVFLSSCISSEPGKATKSAQRALGWKKKMGTGGKG